MKQQVSLDIMQFVETQILPRYTAFGESHGLRHVNRVIKNALKLAHITGADIDMVYVIAAYQLGDERPKGNSSYHWWKNPYGRQPPETMVL